MKQLFVMVALLALVSLAFGCDASDQLSERPGTPSVDKLDNSQPRAMTAASGSCPNNECGTNTQWPGGDGTNGDGDDDDDDDDDDDCPNNECSVDTQWPKDGPKAK